MDKYATLAVCFLLVLSGVTQAICLAYSATYKLGYTGTAAFCENAGELLMYSAYDLDVPEGYLAHITSMFVYANGTGDLGGAIYDEGLNYLGNSSTIQIDNATAAWYECAADITVQKGTFNVVAYYSSGLDYYAVAASSPAGYYQFVDPYPAVLAGSSWGNVKISVYAEYEYVAIINEPTPTTVNWMTFIVLLAFAFLNVVLILIPRVYILNFVVAALTLAFSAATVNDATLPIQPYFSLIVALLSVLGILRAANLLRNS